MISAENFIEDLESLLGTSSLGATISSIFAIEADTDSVATQSSSISSVADTYEKMLPALEMIQNTDKQLQDLNCAAHAIRNRLAEMTLRFEQDAFPATIKDRLLSHHNDSYSAIESSTCADVDMALADSAITSSNGDVALTDSTVNSSNGDVGVSEDYVNVTNTDRNGDVAINNTTETRSSDYVALGDGDVAAIPTEMMNSGRAADMANLKEAKNVQEYLELLKQKPKRFTTSLASIRTKETSSM